MHGGSPHSRMRAASGPPSRATAARATVATTASALPARCRPEGVSRAETGAAAAAALTTSTSSWLRGRPVTEARASR